MALYVRSPSCSSLPSPKALTYRAAASGTAQPGAPLLVRLAAAHAAGYLIVTWPSLGPTAGRSFIKSALTSAGERQAGWVRRSLCRILYGVTLLPFVQFFVVTVWQLKKINGTIIWLIDVLIVSVMNGGGLRAKQSILAHGVQGPHRREISWLLKR